MLALPDEGAIDVVAIRTVYAVGKLGYLQVG